MKNSILSIKDLSKIYHEQNGETKAIDNITFDVLDKEFISIVGPSGCGKSTILGILSNLLDKSKGSISFNKDDFVIGYMLQHDCLLDWCSVLDNCLLGLKISKKLNDENKKFVEDLLKKYGLEDFKDKYPNNLSGGMRQRVALIRTLAIKPDILLLDEPFSALDYQTRLSLSDDVKKIIKEEGKSAIMISHDIAEAISLSDKIIVLTKRPGTIKCIYDIDLEDIAPTKRRNLKGFMNYYDMIWKVLDKNV